MKTAAATVVLLIVAGNCIAKEPDATADFVSLFNGKDLQGWKATENPNTFQVKDGVIVAHGPRSHLFYIGPVQQHDFKDFHFHAQVKTEPGSNSGIYFHTEPQEVGWPIKGFEAQVNNTHSDPKKTGGLYAVKDVMNTSPVQDGEWFDYDIIVHGKHVVIKINGQTTTEWTQPDDWKPPENTSRRMIDHGTFALQGHDPKSTVYYRDIKVKVLK